MRTGRSGLWKLLAALAAAGALGACVQPPTPQGEERVFGAVELEVSSGTGIQAKPQALLDDSKVDFTAGPVEVVDTAGARYINATFTVLNRTGGAIKNLTLYAYTQAGNSIGGTAIKNIFNFSGGAITGAPAAQGVKPAHAMTNATAVDPARADFQAFSASEVAGLEIAARAAGFIKTPDRFLQYGYVARSGTARGIANNGTGTVTLGVRIPKQSDRALEPYRFTMTFVLADSAVTRVTRSREESAAGASSRAVAITDRSTPTQVWLVGPDTETTTCAQCTVTREANALISTAPKNLYDDPANLVFTVERVKEGLNTPWSINFAPDGTLYYTNRDSSRVTVSRLNVSTGAVTTLQGSASNVRDEGEGGVLGMTFAPDFATSNKIYVCYSYYNGGTVADVNRRNRVSSFVISGGALTSETIVFDNMLGWSNHNGCRLAIGPDDRLYISMGDAADYPPGPQKAQDKSSLSGAVFRINQDGSIPTDNPFFSSLTGQARAVWTFGHRNPQGLAFEPWTGALWSTEHGPERNDELNLIQAGKNYGWPVCTGVVVTCGNIPAADYKPAVAQYEPDGSNTIAISDLTFYTATAFPEWRGNLFFVSLKTGRLYRLTLNGQTVASQQILINNLYGRLRDVTVGPDGFIYFSTDQSTNSTIYRVKPQ
jgi:glucose/arabinose dehydrogenase